MIVVTNKQKEVQQQQTKETIGTTAATNKRI